MKRQNILKMLFLSLILTSVTSCGEIERWLGAEQPTDSKPAETAGTKSSTDDLFSDSMTDSTKEIPLSGISSDAPSNITTPGQEKEVSLAEGADYHPHQQAPAAAEKVVEAKPAEVQDDLKSLENEFSGTANAEAAKAEVAQVENKAELKEVKVEEALPEIKEEVAPAISENANIDAGKVMSYKVQKGETLMQIAFKIYGDISKWKELKALNGTRLASNSPLHAGVAIKYNAPEKLFVWNPEGTPRMIRTGETLGTISNDVYQTPKKWRSIWENNKPLIKNPNMIYAGFTLYYKNNGMSNYVQPKAVQRKMASKTKAASTYTNEEFVKSEEKVEQKADLDQANEIQAATSRQSEEVKAEDLKDDFETI